MLFNSLEYLFFLPTVFLFYWFLFNKRLHYQNLLILISSYVFYGWWDWKFLSLIILSTLVDYFMGLKISETQNKIHRNFYLWTSIVCNLSILGFFKYYNFFIDSFIQLVNSFGYDITSIWTLNIILPVGISFYTFQSMSYSLDIYYKKLHPTNNLITFAAFVSFFPQLVAGPIERASSLLPQLINKRKFDYVQAINGISLISWGLFKKVVIADNFSYFVDDIFLNYYDYGSLILIIGVFYFSFQIYCDFSGYSDIAIGTAKLLGFELTSNFLFPYFSRNIREFWRRWHISLSSWFRDYVYKAIGGSRKGRWISLRNIFVIFVISGFWHGANFTFIIWGLIHALLFIPTFLMGNNRKNSEYIILHSKLVTLINDVIKIGLTFTIVSIAWIFFRSENISSAFSYFSIILNNQYYISDIINYSNPLTEGRIIEPLFPFIIFLIYEFKFYFKKHQFSLAETVFIWLSIIYFGNYFTNPTDFIYFQF